MGALTNAVQGFLMGKQRKEQKMSNKFMGNMLMGQSSPEEQQQFAQLNPQAYMQTQNQLQKSQGVAQSSQNQARIKALYGKALMGDDNSLKILAELSPEGATAVLKQRNEQAKQGLAESKESRVARGDQLMAFNDWEDQTYDQMESVSVADRPAFYAQKIAQANELYPDFAKTLPVEYTPAMNSILDNKKSRQELKSGRFKHVTAPNGDVYQVDSATGEREFLFEGIAPQIKLNTGMEGYLAEVQGAARKADKSVSEYTNLAEQLELVDPTSGKAGAVKETLKKWFGVEDYNSVLRKKWIGLKNSDAMSVLRGLGAASDRDIAMAMSSQLDDNAAPNVIASHLRGLAKIATYESLYKNLEANWIATNGNTAVLKKDIEFNGVTIKKGETLNEAFKRIATKHSDKTSNQSADKPATTQRTAQEQVLIDQLLSNGDMTLEQINAHMGW